MCMLILLWNLVMHSTSRFSSEITPEPVAPIVTRTSEQLVGREEILEKDDSEAP